MSMPLSEWSNNRLQVSLRQEFLSIKISGATRLDVAPTRAKCSLHSGRFVNAPGARVALCAAPKKFHFVFKNRRIVCRDVLKTIVFMQIA
jgi:hypothetical protein